MAAALSLEVETRERLGTGGAREARRQGKVPAVVYGAGAEPVHVTLNARDVDTILHTKSFKTKLYELNVGKEKVTVLAKDVQFHPVSDKPEHVDFLRVGKDTEIRVWVPVVFVNQDKSPGLKRGGSLNVVRHEIEFFCKPDSIPASITVDLEGWQVGKSIHIQDVQIPADARPVIDRNFTVATIAGKGGKKDEEETAEGAAEAAGEAKA